MQQTNRKTSPKRSRRSNPHKRSKINKKSETCDVLTGKPLTSVYFDPSHVVDKNSLTNDADWLAEHLYDEAALLKEDDGLFTLKLRSGEVFKVDEITTLSANEKDGVPDILKLHCFSEKSLIHTLRIRYARNQIYTFAGPILVSINPYQSIPRLYDEEVIQQFHRSPLDETSTSEEVAPHLYAITERSYHSLLSPGEGRKRSDQVIIISGESGAGKTEATKLIMTYLASITTSEDQHDRTSRSSSSSDSLEQRVLNSNPILEAFGNARTLRNDNSSRFGKFIKINFNESGRIAGAVIEKYLLEKTRLVRQMPGERNYHIFYQLLRGAPASLLTALHLDDGHNNMAFEYLSNGEMESTSDDAKDFAVTGSCLSCVGIDEDLQHHVFELLAGILHLGDVEFLTGSGGDAVDKVSGVSEETRPQLQRAAALFGLDPQELLLNMVQQNMYVNGSIIVKEQTVCQARDKRNSFAKTIYNQLFSWLVEKVNLTISPTSGNIKGYIGLLDIYGFENFPDANSFEQLLINYANEKLQNYFNKHIFQIEQAEYDAESIDWSYIEFRDNQACLDLIDAKPMGKTGVFLTLDDCISSNSRSDPNATFLSALNQLWSGSHGTRHPNFLTARFNSNRRFGIFHYAGEVYYEIEGFSEKNSEATNLDMKDMMMKSNNMLLRLICDDRSAAAMTTIDASGAKTPMKIKPSNNNNSSVSRNKLREDSISKQFTSSLKHLFTNIELAQPHFIRCIKPNDYKRPNVFNAGSILTQLKYAGMIEAIRIRQQGYALRIEYGEWFNKYSRLAPECTTLHQLVDRLSAVLAVSDESWQVGTTKIFIRHEMNDKLGRLLAIRRAASVRVIHRLWRLIRRRRAVVKIQLFVRNVMKRRKAVRYLRDVVTVQSMVRRFFCRRQYHALTRAVATIQRVGLGKLARMLVRRLRNPFNSMSYYDLVHALRAKQVELRAAFDAQSFATCSDIESSMVSILEARRKLPLPHIEPQSRDLVELHILETQFAIEAGTDRQDSTDSSVVHGHGLQERLQQLLALRKGFPTSKELASELEVARDELKSCMQKKQFKRCAELQSTVTALESAVEQRSSLVGSSSALELVVVSTFELKQKPLVDLRSISIGLEKRMEESLSSKHFELCASLQLELERVQDVIKLKDLSTEDALLAQQEVQLQMKASREVEDYLMMAELQLRMEDLRLIVAEEHQHHHHPLSPVVAAAADVEACIEVPASSDTSMSAADIRRLIREKNAAINIALQNKQYSTCDQLNTEVEQLQHKLEQLPTFAKVKVKMESLRRELNELISKRMYSKCASIEQEIEQLSPLYEQLQREEKEELYDKANVDSSAQRINREIDALKPIIIAPSAVVTKQSIQQNMTVTVPIGPTKYQGTKTVSKLRPRVPITALQSDDVLAVALKMAAHRVDAALLLDSAGRLCGIITDNDLTRRVVSQFVDICGTAVDSVMTRSPKCVRSSDGALDALEMMVDNRFRHLPVLDAHGAVVGLLDIARCLYDTISVLEKVQDSSSSDGGGSSASSGPLAIAQAVTMVMKSSAGGRGANPAQLQAMQLLMEQMFGGSVPTLRSIIGNQALCSIPSSISVREASHLMAEQRKGVLVMDVVGGRKQLVGIITPKDLLNRVITQQLSPDLTAVSSVMTPNPDCVSGDLTLLDALREMHDHRYLHLPVRDDRDGSILGLVDVMELVCSTAGGDGGKGWRDFFSGGLNAKGDNNTEEDSERGSNYHSNMGSKVNKSKGEAKPPSLSRGGKELEKTVSKLRPRVPITALQSDDVLAVALKMAAHRVDAALLLDSAGRLCGIITDNDLTRRVVSQFVDICGTAVDSVMTRSPKCVRSSDGALDALEMMVDNRFRHLPVLDAHGAVVGLLDIARCLYDTISVLEKVQDSSSSDGGGSSVNSGPLAIAQAVTMAMKSSAGGRGANPAQLQAMQLLMEQMFGGAVPTLRSIILHDSKTAVPKVRESVNVREACVIMTAHRKGLLVMDENDALVGIITPRDILNRVIAKGLPPDLTAVSSVMTPNPDCVSGDLTLLDALREMHDHRYLHLPVRDDRDGSILGLVDVMELVCSTAGGDGGKGWRDFFSGGLNAKGDNNTEEDSETRSACSHISMSTEGYSKAKSAGGLLKVKRSSDRDAAAGSDMPSTVVDRMDKPPRQQVVSSSPAAALIGYEIDLEIKGLEDRPPLAIKCIVSDADGVRDVVASKLSLSAVDRSSLVLHMVDQVGREVLITSDSMLMESIHRSRSMGLLSSVKIVASLNRAPIGRKSGGTLVLVGGGLLCISLIAVAALVLKKNKCF